MSNQPNFEIVVGTYEEYILGYTLSRKETGYDMTQSFATHAHSSSIRCVTSSGKYLASGSADDRIIVYDMKSRKEHCMLNHHNSTITCLEFTPRQTHIVTGSSDGILAIVRVGNWQLEKIWEKPHKGSALIDLAVHPTGKLALTLGSDHTLRTWNLIKGRQAYAVNLNTKSTDAKSLDSVKWAPDGETFVLSGGMNVEIWNISTGGIVNKFQYTSRVTSTSFLSQKIIAVGHEDGKITILNIKKEKQRTVDAHKMRVKCLQISDNWLVSTSSDGHIKIWEFNGKTIEEKGDCNTGCRCTSLTLVSAIEKKEESNEDEDENVEEKEEQENEDSDDGEKANVIKTNTIFKNDRGCKVVIEDESETTTKKRKKRKNKNKNIKTVKKSKNEDDNSD